MEGTRRGATTKGPAENDEDDALLAYTVVYSAIISWLAVRPTGRHQTGDKGYRPKRSLAAIISRGRPRTNNRPQ